MEPAAGLSTAGYDVEDAGSPSSSEESITYIATEDRKRRRKNWLRLLDEKVDAFMK